MRLLSASVLAVASAATAAPTSKLLWQQHENTAVYTSVRTHFFPRRALIGVGGSLGRLHHPLTADVWRGNESGGGPGWSHQVNGLSRHIGSTPTFAVATWLNQPFYIESYNCTDNGSNIWQFQFQGTPPVGDIPTYFVTMARHATEFPPEASAIVDTVGAGAFFVPPSGCTVYGWDSRTTNKPVWNWTLPNCDSSLLYDEYRNLAIADSGTVVAFNGFIPAPGQKSTPSLHVFDAQTGKVLFAKGTADAGAGAGTVSVSKAGAYVTWSSAEGLIVYTAPAGTLRDKLVGVEGPNEISDSGDYIAGCTEDKGSIYYWGGSAYDSNFTIVPPTVPASENWFCVDVAMSSDGKGGDGELVSFAWISQDVLTARVTTYNMVSKKLVTDWVSSTNTKLQTNPTIRMDEQYVGVSLWGDQDDVNTAIVLAAGSNVPLFGYTTPGSMFGVEIVVDHAASTPTNDVLYFAVSGKATPANAFGNGGDAFAWRIDVPL